MQTIRIYDDKHVKLYRGGLAQENESASFYSSNLGKDPYNRKRVIPKTEMGLSYEPLDNKISISNGCILYEWSNVYKYDEKPSRVKRFLGLPKKIKNFCIDLNLWCCFTMDGRLVLFKEGCYPKRKEHTYTKYTRVVEEWSGYEKSFGEKNPKYFVKWWEFEKEEDYLICAADHEQLFTVFPEIYESVLRNMYLDIQKYAFMSSSYNRCTSNECESEKETNNKLLTDTIIAKNDYLWNIEPFSLNNAWDYNDEQKEYISKVRQQIKDAETKRYLELERLKNTPGHCQYCGADHADYVANPFDEEMYGVINREWICPDCYENIAMDI